LWERRASIRWSAHITITQEDFYLPNKRQRWVSKLHSLDSERGEAILQIAEGDAPWNAPRITIAYSWRRWDLVHNREISQLQMCKNPFEVFRGGDADAV
jgi:hypothetical protein